MGKAKTTKIQRRIGLKTAPVEIKDVSGSLPNLHYELGTGKTEDGREMRFLMHVNHACFWLQIGNEMYQVLTEDFMHAFAEGAMS